MRNDYWQEVGSHTNMTAKDIHDQRELIEREATSKTIVAQYKSTAFFLRGLVNVLEQ